MSCYKCKDRKPYCHSTCETYKSYKEKTNKVNQKRCEESSFENYLYEAKKRMKDKRGVMRI